MATPHPVLARLGHPTYVGVDLECPRQGCNARWRGTALSVNEYGVRDCQPAKCKCGITGRVVLIVDVSDPSTWPLHVRLERARLIMARPFRLAKLGPSTRYPFVITDK